ncbi:MAG: hypothetical protein ACRC20_12790 [Segniliparus sp.]|uniref:hypothetical protein n=1 Tax=Segniliparus sp. TaxID=2804064 RepID=UPI003F2C4B6B
MSFSVDDPYGLIQIANSLSTSESESAIMLIMYVSERFDKLGSTVNQFPGIPRDQFDSVVRDDFEPRLLEVGTDSASTGESLIGMASTLKQFYDQVPQVKSAAANLEQVLHQSSSPAEWKAAAEPLASALNNLYSVKIPSAPAANQSLEAAAQAKPKAVTEDPKPAPSDTGKPQGGSGGSPSGGQQPVPSATPKPQTSGSSQSQPAAQDSGSGGGSPSGGGSGGGDQGGGSGGSPAGAGASPSAGSPDAGKKQPSTAAALPSSTFDPLASTGLQSADLAPPSSGIGLGGAGGGIGAGGLDPKSLGAAAGSAAGLASAGAGVPGAGAPAGAVRGMSSMMGGMMGPGMMGGRGGGGEKEHKAPDYLYSEDNGYELIEKLPVVSPDVIGALTDDEIDAMELQTDFAFSDPA